MHLKENNFYRDSGFVRHKIMINVNEGLRNGTFCEGRT